MDRQELIVLSERPLQHRQLHSRFDSYGQIAGIVVEHRVHA